jgi:hypothetical protein
MMTQDNEALLRQFATIHNVTWRNGQENAIVQILDAHSQNKKCVILDAPTGAGKSLIAMAAAWCLAQKRHTSYILVSDLALQRQYSQDFAKLRLNYPSVMGVKNYECHESKTPVSVGWCSGNLVKLGVKRKDLPCYSTCGYYSARDAAQNSSVALLNYAYWLMQMNYVNLRLRRGEAETDGRQRTIPPPVYVLIFEALFVAERGVEGWGDLGRNQSSVAVKIGSKPATAASARCNCGGRDLPRLAARRRIPAQAFWLK